jgi:hypothetical protein
MEESECLLGKWKSGYLNTHKMFNPCVQNEQGDTPEGSAPRYKSRIWKTILKMSRRVNML